MFFSKKMKLGDKELVLESGKMARQANGSAVVKYGEEHLKKYGIVPWHIQSVRHWLTMTMKEHDYEQIIKLSADLGHYIADAHVPLHSTENYNGQLTNQKGVHGLWESRLPEIFASDYDYFTGKAVYLSNPLETIWQSVSERKK